MTAAKPQHDGSVFTNDVISAGSTSRGALLAPDRASRSAHCQSASPAVRLRILPARGGRGEENKKQDMRGEQREGDQPLMLCRYLHDNVRHASNMHVGTHYVSVRRAKTSHHHKKTCKSNQPYGGVTMRLGGAKESVCRRFISRSTKLGHETNAPDVAAQRLRRTRLEP